MLRLSLIAVVLSLAWISISNGEYVWTGSEWKWKDPAESDLSLPSGGSDTSSSFGGTSNLDEGSGDGDNWDDDYDEEDYEDYTYEDYDKPSKPKKDKKKNKWEYGDDKKNKKKNKNRDRDTGILPASDDEDFYEGSGSDDFDLPRANNNPYKNNFNNPVSQFTTPQTTSLNNNNNQNVYVDGEGDEYEYDDEYDDEYDYDEDEDISFGGNTNENPWDTGYNNVIVDTTVKPRDNIYNMNNINNVWENPATTVRSYTPRSSTTTTTVKPISNHGIENNNRDHSFIPVNRPASFFAQPGILAAVIGGAVVGLLCAILLVMFIVYRMRKKDEGSYALDEPKRAHNVNSYSKPPSREFYA